MSGSSRVVLDSDDEDGLDEELELNTEVKDREPTSSDHESHAATSLGETASPADSSALDELIDTAQTAFANNAGTLKRGAAEAHDSERGAAEAHDSERGAAEAHDSERGRLKRPKVEPEPAVHRYVEDPYEGSQPASQQQQPTESQLQEVYRAVINAPSSTVMDSATPHPLAGDDATVAPADLQLGNGDITFHEDDADLTSMKSYLTPMTSTSHQTSWDYNTMSKPVVMIPCPPRSVVEESRPKRRRELSPDELSSDQLIGMPKEMYQARPSRSRSLRLENDGKKSPDPEASNGRSRKRGRRASVGAMMQIHQESLEGMGFRASQAELALQVTGGNLDQAVDWLCVDKSEVSERKPAKDEHMGEPSRDGKSSTPDTVSVPSQTIETEQVLEPEQEPEPEPEPTTKKRKGAAKKKTPAKSKKKQQRSKVVVEDAEMHEQEPPVKHTEEATEKHEEEVDGQNDVEEQEPFYEPMRKTRGQEKKFEVDEQHEDELAETTDLVQDEEGDDIPVKVAPKKSTRRGRGRPKKVVLQVETLEDQDDDEGDGEHVDEAAEDADQDEPNEQAVDMPTEPQSETDGAVQAIEEDHEDRQVLAEKSTNAILTRTQVDVTESKPEPAKPKVKQIPGDANLVRATPPLRLSNGPGHRVGLSKRRPIQSLLRIIKR